LKLQSEKQTILQFLRSNVLATISTVNKKTHKPESALIAFAELATLEIIFITREDSRKYMNLISNKHVSLVIGWDSKQWKTLQYEGDAYAVNKRDYPACKDFFAKKKDTPCTAEFLSSPLMKFFKIKPTWIGFSNFTGEKPHVIEIKKF
jgi:general stress protein 26